MITKKVFVSVTLIAISLLLVFVIVSASQYDHYKKGQEVAIASLRVVTNQFEKYSDDTAKMVTEMHDYLIRAQYSEYTRYVDADLGQILRNAGYDCVKGSEYLEYTDYIGYAFGRMTLFAIVTVIVVVSDIAVGVLYFKEQNN